MAPSNVHSHKDFTVNTVKYNSATAASKIFVETRINNKGVYTVFFFFFVTKPLPKRSAVYLIVLFKRDVCETVCYEQMP